jgi:nitrous oxidase accessory protein NosD
VLSLRKVTVNVLLILTLLLSAVVQAQLAFTASAQISELVISVRQDGSIDPSTAPIQREGAVYTLTSDVNCNTIIIQRDNVVFDGANHTIELFGAIGISERENVTFKNAIIKAGLGISLSGSNNKIIGNTFHINATNAIAVSYTGFPTTSAPSGNIISDNTIELKNGENGVWVFKALDTVISNNTIFTAENSSQVVSGIVVQSSHDTTVVGNSINVYATYGVAILKYLDATPPQGEALSGFVRENTIMGNYSYGVYSNCPNVDIVGNRIIGEPQKNPDSYGIVLREDSNDNIISQNYVAKNGYGICFQPFLNNAVSGSLRFSVSENSFVDNAVQARINMSNCVIDWSKNHRGNYWSDYTGDDANNDGIGDTPYAISNENYDNYPLMAPFEALPSPEPQPKDSFPTALIVASVITVAVVGVGLLVYFKKRKH